MREIISVPLNQIATPNLLRETNEGKLRGLSDSMRTIGLQTPISVSHGGGPEKRYRLVTGFHRLQAATFLGWSEIPAVMVDDLDEPSRRLWQIDENLMRLELSAAEETRFMRERKKAFAEVQSRQVASIEKTRREREPHMLAYIDNRPETGAKKRGHRRRGFAAKTAQAMGKSKTTVLRLIKRAENIPDPVLDRVKGTELDCGQYLDKLAAFSPEAQARKVETDLEKGSEPRAPIPIQSARQGAVARSQVAQMEALYLAALPEARREIRSWIAAQTWVDAEGDDSDCRFFGGEYA